jgi:[acyl-carrier-protein] S-malonyltransferase
MNWNSVAFVFPGQGSQVVGMGKDIAETYPVARQTFEQADAILGTDFSRLCFEGPEETLNNTYNTQPALYICGMAIFRTLQSELPDARPAFLAGHSLGELTALAAGGAMTFEDGLRLVRERGRLMDLAGEQSPGAMAALLGLDAEQVREICTRASQQTGKTLVLANDNCPGQIVISGDVEALEAGMTLAKEAGARRALKLAVSIASHSPLMQPAADAFAEAVNSTGFAAPAAPVYSNVQAAPLATADDIRQELIQQLTHSVRWTETIQRMIADGAETFLELGSKDVLTGLIRRIDSAKNAMPVNSVDALKAFVHSATA